MLLAWSTFAQSYKLENFDSTERQKQIKDLTEHVESNEMNPGLKKIKSEFAIDTFKIEHFQRKFPSLKVNLGTSLAVIKSSCTMYDSLNNKYLGKLKKILKNKDYDDLIASQEAWEKYRLTELKYFERLINEDFDFEYNFYYEYKQILKMRLETLFFYYAGFKEFRYRN